jgi:hypothetical protein
LVAALGCGAKTDQDTRDSACQAGDPSCTPTVGSQPPTGGPPSGPSGAGTGAVVDGLPCDVAPLITQHCVTCHSERPRFSAPMPLTKLSHFQVAAPTMPARKVYEVAIDRINATDIKLRMPPASGAAITPANLQILNTWLGGGAVAGSTSCEVVDPMAPPTTTGGSGMGGSSMTMGTGGTTSTMGTGGSMVAPPPPADDVQCYELRAHAPGNKTAPFSVPNQPDLYTNFTFMPPWQGMQYGRSFRVLTDNVDVIHHWLLYKNSTPGPDGAVDPSIGAHPNGELVHGWAPGGDDLVLNADVGIEMPGTVSYTLETHHNNLGSGPVPDASGIEVCVTPTRPTNIASLSWLGTDMISGTTATGTCDPASNERIHILGATPHMHTKGRHMKVVINRASGTQEMLHDEPFDFDYQHSYDHDVWIEPGDRITTTCTYSSPAQFGEGTGDEMCYFFTLYYPKLALTAPGLGAIIHGPNTCLGF